MAHPEVPREDGLRDPRLPPLAVLGAAIGERDDNLIVTIERDLGQPTIPTPTEEAATLVTA